MKKLMLITPLLIALIVSLPITLAATQNLIYDANGNLVTGDGKYRIYDGFNHLVQIKNGNDASGTILENITWHPLEERTLVKAVYETNGSWKETVYYISKSFVRVKNSSGNFDYKYIYQNGQLVAQELVGGQKNFMLNDHKGTVAVVVNESGAKIEETFYSPFGEIISGGATSRFDYEGKEFDSVVGDYDYHARKVNSQWGMFTSPDTMLPNVYDPQQLNRYAFERNNPSKYEDDNGNNPVLAMALAGFAIGTLSYAIQHRGEGLRGNMGMAIAHGVIGGIAGAAAGLTITGAGGHIAAQTTARAIARMGISGAESAAHNLIEGEDIDYNDIISSAIMGLFLPLESFGPKSGTFYSINGLTKNSYLAASQYSLGNIAQQAFSGIYNYLMQNPNINNQQQIANQASQMYNQAESIAHEIAGGGSSGGGSSGGGYNWGVEEVGNTLQVIVVVPVED